MFKEAVLYKTLEGGNIQCFLCAHRCFIKIGQLGKCKVRLNQGGNLFTLNYGKLIAKHVDPIEKSRYFTSFLDRFHIQLLHRDVILLVRGAKIGKFHNTCNFTPKLMARLQIQIEL